MRDRHNGLPLPQPLLPLPKQSLELPGALDRGVSAGGEDPAQDLRTLLVDPPHPQDRPALHHARHQSGVRGQVLLRGEPGDVPDLFQDDLRGVEVHPGEGHQLLDGGVPRPELRELSLDLLHLMSQDFELRQEPFDQVALGGGELGGGLGHLPAPGHPEDVGEVGRDSVVDQQCMDLALHRVGLLPQVHPEPQQLSSLVALGGGNVRYGQAIHPKEIRELVAVESVRLLLDPCSPTHLQGVRHPHVETQPLQVPVDPLGDSARLQGEHAPGGECFRPSAQRSQIAREAGGGDYLSLVVEHGGVTVAFMGIDAYVHPITSVVVVVRVEHAGRTRHTPLRGRAPGYRVDGGQTSDGVHAP